MAVIVFRCYFGFLDYTGTKIQIKLEIFVGLSKLTQGGVKDFIATEQCNTIFIRKYILFKLATIIINNNNTFHRVFISFPRAFVRKLLRSIHRKILFVLVFVWDVWAGVKVVASNRLTHYQKTKVKLKNKNSLFAYNE